MNEIFNNINYYEITPVQLGILSYRLYHNILNEIFDNIDYFRIKHVQLGILSYRLHPQYRLDWMKYSIILYIIKSRLHIKHFNIPTTPTIWVELNEIFDTIY